MCLRHRRRYAPKNAGKVDGLKSRDDMREGSGICDNVLKLDH